MALQSSAQARRGRSAPAASFRYEDETVRDVPFDELRLTDFRRSKPWRTVRSVHGMAHHSGSYASATTNGHVVYESRLELARLLLADFDPAVQAIYAQPFRMTAKVDGRVRHHVPDFLLIMQSGVVQVVNVKPADLLADPKIKDALAWPRKLVGRHGWGYEVWSGADPILLENVRFLAAYRRPGVVPAEEIERAWASVQDGDQLAAAEHRLAEGRDPHEVRPSIMALLWAGHLTTDLTTPLSGNWVLRRSG